MKRELIIETVSFNAEYYVDANAEKEGTFLECDYGYGLYFQTPAEILAYSLIMENKEILMNENNKPEFSKKMLLKRVNNLVDFPEVFSKEDFHLAVRKTLLQKQFNPKDFMKKLEANIDFNKDSKYNHLALKEAFIDRIRNVIEINKNTQEADVISQISAIDAPPKGYSKIELITSVMDAFNDQEQMFLNNYPELFEKVSFLDDEWLKNTIEKIKERKVKKNSEGPLSKEEEIDIINHVKAIHNSQDDMVELLKINSQVFLSKEDEPKLSNDYFKATEFDLSQFD